MPAKARVGAALVTQRCWRARDCGTAGTAAASLAGEDGAMPVGMRLTRVGAIAIIDMYQERAMQRKRARLFWTGRSQAVRLPKEFRFPGDAVLVRRQGGAVLLEPADVWPEGWVESFTGVPADFGRPPQGRLTTRERLG
jgi:antitoxin VapB